MAVMKHVAAAKFKAQCLALLDRLDPEGLIITKHGRAVARVVPVREAPVDLIGSLKGRLTIKGNILSTGVAWDAESRHARPASRRRRRAQRG
jgi:antitoxin (DNA-binding transcriptional repressor) of toxin-antitoxin stability system